MKFLVSSDWHFRDDRPRCRKDTWSITQERKLQFVVNTINEHKCAMFVPGDILDSGTVSPTLENMMIRVLREAKYPIYTIAGNHDAPYHNIKHLYRSSYMVLAQAGVIRHADAEFVYENMQVMPVQYGDMIPEGDGILMCHRLVFPHVPPPYLSAVSADDMFEQYNYNIILSGDNHTPFFKQRGDRVLINGGGLMRQDADKKNINPLLFLYTDGAVLKIPVPIEIDVVGEEHLINQRHRDIRISTLVERVKLSKNIGLNFKNNIDNNIHDVRDEVVEIIYKAIKGELKTW